MKGSVLTIEELDGSEWCDKDYAMFAACFQLLCDYIEIEKGYDIIDWENSDHRDQHEEVWGLYRWYKDWYLPRRDQTDWLYEKELETPDGVKTFPYAYLTEKLVQLVNLRECLWS